MTVKQPVLSSDSSVDLQMHTTFSDGTWTPEALVEYLEAEGFALGAVTDHDRADATAIVQRLGAKKGLPMLAAVEMSTSWRGEATDVLCYGFEPGRNQLEALGLAVVKRQEEITQEIYQKLLREGYRFPRESEILGERGGEALGANELQRLLLEHGYSTGPGSIGKLITDAGFHFATNHIAEVVEAAHASGAVCLIAHPGRGDDFTRYDAEMLDELRREVPIDGIEAHYPSHSREQVEMYVEYADKHGLLVSAGSDSHGPEKTPIKYPAELSRRLLERLGIAVWEA